MRRTYATVCAGAPGMGYLRTNEDEISVIVGSHVVDQTGSMTHPLRRRYVRGRASSLNRVVELYSFE
jgi:hypothetical protein